MKRDQKIITRAWVHVGDELVNVDTLSPEKRQELATQITLGVLSTMYAGRAEFRRSDEADPNDGRAWEPLAIGGG